MTTIVTRAGKGSPLTHTEVDTNFTNLNTAKLEAGAIALGSAGTPSISFVSDANTGIFSPGADQLAVATNGTSRLHITSGGLVGIGNSSPSRLLHLSAADSTSFNSADFDQTYNFLRIVNTTHDKAVGIYFGVGNNGEAAITAAEIADGETALVFGTRGGGARSERARLDHAGRLLVGTTTATGANLLQVNSDALVNGHTVGRGAGAVDTNVAIGDSALSANTNGLQNVAIGVSAMSSNTGGDYNTAVGLQASRFNTVSDDNTAVGYQTIYSNTGAQNTAIGSSAGYAGASGAANSTGTNNTFVGYYAVGASATASNTITLGNSSITTLRCATATITTISDARDKTNIIDIPAGLDFIQALHPVAFDWDTRDKAKVGIHEFGFIAQELQIAQENTGIVVPNLVSEANPEKLEVAISTLLPVLVKAIQEQQAMITNLLARVTALEGQ